MSSDIARAVGTHVTCPGIKSAAAPAIRRPMDRNLAAPIPIPAKLHLLLIRQFFYSCGSGKVNALVDAHSVPAAAYGGLA